MQRGKIMKMSEQIHELSTALSIAQGEMRNAEKNGKGNFGKYSNLESVWDVARECLPPQGLSVVQDVTSADKGINVETTLMHKSGQWMTFGPLFIPANAFTAHAFASACSYGKRYSLCACLGIVSGDATDDDGQAAQDSSKVKPPEQGKTPTQIITKDQAFELKELLKWLDKSIETKLLTAYAIKSIEELPVTSFVPTLTRLKAMFDEKKVES
jgi:hypothetical protein